MLKVRAGLPQQVSGQEDLRGDGHHGQHGGHPDELVQRVQAARGAACGGHQDPAGHGLNSEQWAGAGGGPGPGCGPGPGAGGGSQRQQTSGVLMQRKI